MNRLDNATNIHNYTAKWALHRYQVHSHSYTPPSNRASNWHPQCINLTYIHSHYNWAVRAMLTQSNFKHSNMVVDLKWIPVHKILMVNMKRRNTFLLAAAGNYIIYKFTYKIKRVMSQRVRLEMISKNTRGWLNKHKAELRQITAESLVSA